jgi:hypothetical protein
LNFRDKDLEEIKPKLAKLLKDEGYSTPAELDAKVQSVLKGEQLSHYLRVKAE